MSSHCFIKTSKCLEANEVEKDLRDIIRRKFADLLKVEAHTVAGEICDWNIVFDELHKFPICLKTQNKIVFMHPDDAWSYWAQLVIEDELAIIYNGEMTDEEYPQQEVKPLPEQHANFKTYLESTIHHSPEWKKALIQIEFSRLPEALKKL